MPTFLQKQYVKSRGAFRVFTLLRYFSHLTVGSAARPVTMMVIEAFVGRVRCNRC